MNNKVALEIKTIYIVVNQTVLDLEASHYDCIAMQDSS